jgi:hypothetical protein
VETLVGYHRRNFLVPVPSPQSPRSAILAYTSVGKNSPRSHSATLLKGASASKKRRSWDRNSSCSADSVKSIAVMLMFYVNGCWKDFTHDSGEETHGIRCE